MKEKPELPAAGAAAQPLVKRGRAGRKVEEFLAMEYPKGAYWTILQTYIRKRRGRGLSEHTLARIYYNLHPLGQALDNPPLTDLSAAVLRSYLDGLWLRYAPDTMRTIIGDVRMFFKWAKKKGHSKNIAKHIKPVRQNPRRRRRARAAPEVDVQRVMEFLAGQLKDGDLVYRDLFRVLQPAETGWGDGAVRALRDLLILTFLYETGARVGELSRLGSQAMDEVTSRRAAVYLVTVTGKTNDRDRYFTERTAELWRIWQRVRPAGDRAFAVVGWRNDREPAQILGNGISLMLERRCQKAGVRPFRAQSLRHAKVRRSRQQVGLDMASVLIDHSALRTTWGYANIDDEEIAAAAAATGLQTDFWGGE